MNLLLLLFPFYFFQYSHKNIQKNVEYLLGITMNSWPYTTEVHLIKYWIHMDFLNWRKVWISNAETRRKSWGCACLFNGTHPSAYSESNLRRSDETCQVVKWDAIFLFFTIFLLWKYQLCMLSYITHGLAQITGVTHWPLICVTPCTTNLKNFLY